MLKSSIRNMESKFSFFYCFVIFSKFLDEIEDIAPEHHTKEQIFINSSTCALARNVRIKSRAFLILHKKPS